MVKKDSHNKPALCNFQIVWVGSKNFKIFILFSETEREGGGGGEGEGGRE